MAFQYIAQDLVSEKRRNREECAFLRCVDNPFDLEVNSFKKLYRLTPEMTYELVGLLDSRLEMNRISALSAEKQVFAALRFYATGCYQRPVGEQWGISMCQSSISRSIHKVTDAINSLIFRQQVRFPMTQAERQASRLIFRAAREPFDGAIGAIDCSHVAILGPKIHEEAYVNHHGYHSINVQAICDSNLKILNINARYPGARHDAYIWNASAARQAMKRAYERGDRQSFLIGDSGYPLEPWLMTPLTNQPEGSPNFRYNEALCKARNCDERLFGVMKSTWRCLSKQRVLMYDPGFAGRIINACATLHNFRISSFNSDVLIYDNEEVHSQLLDNESTVQHMPDTALAKRVQNRLIAAKFS